MRIVSRLALAAGIFLSTASGAKAANDVMVILDGSNSMWGQIDGVSKIEIARTVMSDLIGDWTEDANVGLMAYGHRKTGDCTDIETLIEPGPFDRNAFMARVGEIRPTGRTPLTSAVEQAAETLAYRDNPATVVLVTDGVETCQRNPCELAEELARGGVGFTAHVVGFDLTEGEAQDLGCIAERTGGQFLLAHDAAELRTALGEVGAVVAEAADPKPKSPPASETEPTQAINVSAPDSAAIGSSFEVNWSDAIHRRDFISLVPMGAEQGTKSISWKYVGKKAGSGFLRAPAEPGLYEVRYVLDKGKRILASAPIEVVEKQVEVSAPETAVIGSSFEVNWSDAIHRRDFVSLVPMGAKQGTKSISWTYVGKKAGSGSLRAPAEPGLYEVRYVLDVGKRILASAPVEIVEPQVEVSRPETSTGAATLDVPDRAAPGEAVQVSWTAEGDNDADRRIALAAPDQADFTWIAVKLAGDEQPLTFTMPDKPGGYEFRFLDISGRQVLDRVVIEVQ